jgi:hypothetical protein
LLQYLWAVGRLIVIIFFDTGDEEAANRVGVEEDIVDARQKDYYMLGVDRRR